MQRTEYENLAPAGNLETAKIAIKSGANAVFCQNVEDLCRILRMRAIVKGQRDLRLISLPLINDRCASALYRSAGRARHDTGDHDQTKAETEQTFTAPPAHPASQSGIPAHGILGSHHPTPRHWWPRWDAAARSHRCGYGLK